MLSNPSISSSTSPARALADDVDSAKRRPTSPASRLVVGALRQNGGAQSVAAVSPQLQVRSRNHVSMKAERLISPTHNDGVGILSSAGRRPTSRSSTGRGHGLLLRPSLYATMQEDVLDHMDTRRKQIVAGDRLGHDLTGDAWPVLRAWSCSIPTIAKPRYGQARPQHRSVHKSDLELGYGSTPATGRSARSPLQPGSDLGGASGHGPRMAIDGSYSFTATERGYDDNDAEAAGAISPSPQPQERLELAAHRRGVARSAAYDYEQDHHRRSGLRARQPRRLGEFRADF